MARRRRALLLAAAGAAAVVVAGAAAILPALVDVEKHRPAVERALSEAAGREVRLGALRLSLLPLPALAAAGITIGEDARFGAEPFLKADRLEVRVRLLPLLAGHVHVASLEIDAPRVRLHRRRERGWNLASLAAGPRPEARGSAPAAGAPAAAAADEPASGSKGGVALSVGRVRLARGSVALVDEELLPGKILTTEARGIDLTLTDLSATSPVGVDLAFDIAGSGRARLVGRIGPPPPAGLWPVDARLKLSGFSGGPAAPYLEAFTGVVVHGGSLDLDLAVRTGSGGEAAVEGTATLSALDVDPLVRGGRRVRLDASMDMAGTLSGEATRLSRCDVRAGGSALSVTGALTGLGDRPAVDARVVAREVALRDVAAVLGWFGPLLPSGLGSAGEVSVDARVRGPLDDPSRLSVEGRASLDGVEYRDPSLKAPITGIGGAVALGGGRAAITGFTASLGASRVEGACALSRFERPVLDVRLSSPNLDVDELLSLVAAAPAGAAVVPASGARERGVVRARRPAAPEPVPSSLLRDVTVRGELAVKQAKVINLRLADARAQLALEAGVARLRDVEVRLYGGRLTGEVSAAPAEAGPPFDLSARVEGVDFNALASDLSPDLRGLVHGTLQARLDVRGRGLGTPELRRALAGTAAIALADGKVTSFGLLKTLAKALEKAGGRGIGKEETPFRSLTGTFEIAKGRARTEDLELDSDDLDVKGKGALALDLGLDLDLGARIAAPVAADMVAATPSLRHLQDDEGRLALDFTLGGTLLEPSVGIAPEMLRRAARSAAKEKLKEKKKDVLEKLLGKGE